VDTAFETTASAIRFGRAITREVGMDLADMGAKRVLVVCDPSAATAVETTIESLKANAVPHVVYDAVAIEPTDRSFRAAIDFGQRSGFDALVALGGGSTIDTAKAINLYVTCPPSDFYDYVNLPVGKAVPIPAPLKPLIAIPTTAGTGSETTGVCIFDDTTLHVKTGISGRRLKPTLGILDPDNTRSMPAMVATACGFDVLCHAVESFTTIAYTRRPRPERPSMRPAYQGANPLSDVWALEALRLIERSFVRAVENPGDDEARADMMLAASYAGMGFGTAGVHLPHAMSYPVSGHVREFHAEGYPPDRPLVPHGLSVILNAPAAFRFTASSTPERHLEAARMLGADVSRASPGDAGAVLAARIVWFMRRLGLPTGLAAIGYSTADIPELVAGTLLQRRLTTMSPREATREDLARMFEESMVIAPT
jgi:hydroxyacid-oxoacid transhydrogenase